jgi:hypothetical protein
MLISNDVKIMKDHAGFSIMLQKRQACTWKTKVTYSFCKIEGKTWQMGTADGWINQIMKTEKNT